MPTAPTIHPTTLMDTLTLSYNATLLSSPDISTSLTDILTPVTTPGTISFFEEHVQMEEGLWQAHVQYTLWQSSKTTTRLLAKAASYINHLYLVKVA